MNESFFRRALLFACFLLAAASSTSAQELSPFAASLHGGGWDSRSEALGAMGSVYASGVAALVSNPSRLVESPFLRVELSYGGEAEPYDQVARRELGLTWGAGRWGERSLVLASSWRQLAGDTSFLGLRRVDIGFPISSRRVSEYDVRGRVFSFGGGLHWNEHFDAGVTLHAVDPRVDDVVLAATVGATASFAPIRVGARPMRVELSAVGRRLGPDRELVLEFENGSPVEADWASTVLAAEWEVGARISTEWGRYGMAMGLALGQGLWDGASAELERGAGVEVRYRDRLHVRVGVRRDSRGTHWTRGLGVRLPFSERVRCVFDLAGGNGQEASGDGADLRPDSLRLALELPLLARGGAGPQPVPSR